MRQNDVDVIIFKNRFMMKHARINELMSKLFTFAKFHQIDINNNNDNCNDCVDYVEFKRSALLI